MRLKEIEISGFKSFAKKALLSFTSPVTSVVGPNGSGKSNVVEAFRFVLGEQSMKSMRGKSGADLIFRGGNSAPKLSRASVSITFDNTDKVFKFSADENAKTPLIFDEVTFTREIYSDGTSRYLMNGTEIRLKQMVELLSSVNIGTSSHHIISQGEADGILRASPRDRREILEDALGLKVYHFRIRESESKLGKAMETLKEVQSLRRELAPHLNFLKKQVEKVEKGRAIRQELEQLLVQYLATERSYLSQEDVRLAQARNLIEHKKKQLEELLATLPAENTVDHSAADRAKINQELQDIREKRRGVETRISRLEGMIEAQRQMLHAQHPQNRAKSVSFEINEYENLLEDLESLLGQLRNAQSLEETKASLHRLDTILAALKEKEGKNTSVEEKPIVDTGIRDTALELEDLQRQLKNIVAKEEQAQGQLQMFEREREAMLATTQEATRKRYEVIGDIKQAEAELQILEVSRSGFLERRENFDTELKEAGFLFGPSFLHELQQAQAIPEFNVQDQKRAIDRLKIRLDEHAGIGNEVVTEYESTVERDTFLSREVTDIEASIKNLETLIIDLKRILDERFSEGVKVINDRFGDFFKTMFGGGSASLSVILEKKRKRRTGDDEEEGEMGSIESEEQQEQELEKGIEVHVNLPEKKVKELNMLSGGERSLVSIALLFAISQVNPPPFLVLDETDAALDEANSRRYGDMIELLAEYSQLIVVTHNRETMSRASVLYGVTLGSDGGSKLLSIKFDEAVKVAK
ncbi:MAG TPA: AAA family ATPase [Candidatus Paceibacterota bacterium]|jgi:chromosome segregation protein|nr:AAA family ATPase [Candidatus Paceibacterota bacterium]